MKIFAKSILVALLVFFMNNLVWSSNQEKEIQALAKMNLQELTARAMPLVAKKYPGETWKSYNFPKFVYINDSVLVSYKIAVKETRLLAQFSLLLFLRRDGSQKPFLLLSQKGDPW